MLEKVCKRARHLETLTVEERHEFRKSAEAVALCGRVLRVPLCLRRVEPFLKRLKKLREVFGSLNDAATVKALLSRSILRQTARAVGWMVGASRAAPNSAGPAPSRTGGILEGTRPFWK